MILSFDNLISKFSGVSLLATNASASEYHGLQVNAEIFFEVMKTLREDENYRYVFLLDHLAVDHLNEKIFDLYYVLFSPHYNDTLIVMVKINRDNPVIQSVSSLWPIAQWQEREVFDLFGVLYDGHVDLRRLFLDDDWKGFPLRKDYTDDFIIGCDE